MLISCSICQELIHASQNPLFIECGHIYHDECLVRWLEQKKSCPQCRSSVRIQPMKVYFNVSDQEGLNESVADRLAASESECYDLKTEKQRLDKELSLREYKLEKANRKIQDLEGKISDDKCIIASCRMQIDDLKAENIKVVELKRKLAVAEKEAEQLSSLKVMMQGTEKDVSERLSNYAVNEKSLQQLCMHVEVLKRQSEKYQQRCKELTAQQQPLKNEITALKRSRVHMEERLDELLRNVDERMNRPMRSPGGGGERKREVVDLADDSIDDILKENFMLPGGKELKLVSATEGERLKRKNKETRDTGPLGKRSLLQKSNSSSDFVYDGMGGSVRTSSIVVPMTREEKAAAYAAAQAKEKAAKAKKMTATFSRPEGSKSTSATAASSSIRNFLKSYPEPTAPSGSEHSFIELD